LRDAMNQAADTARAMAERATANAPNMSIVGVVCVDAVLRYEP
jgi:hypothetical protein